MDTYFTTSLPSNSEKNEHGVVIRSNTFFFFFLSILEKLRLSCVYGPTSHSPVMFLSKFITRESKIEKLMPNGILRTYVYMPIV